MSLPLLIVGGTEEKRKSSALESARKISSVFDTSLIDTREASGIDTIRSINQKLTRRPFDSPYQSIILLEVQNLTIEAQNAFLKSLEETSPSAQIFLTSPTAESLLSTVVSRCQKLELETQNEDITQTQWHFLKTFLQSSYYNRYAASDKLDFDSWLAIWRKILLSTLDVGNVPFNLNVKPAHTLRYLRLVNKLRSLQRRRAAQKLLKTILILETPRLEITEAK